MARTQRIPEEQTKLHHIYADEACQTKHKFMVLGTTMVADENLNRVRDAFISKKEEMGLKGEIKWEQTDKWNLARYKTIADMYLEFIKTKVLRFNSMIIEVAGIKLKYKSDAENVPEFAYNRFFHYLLLQKYCQQYSKSNKYNVLFDHRTAKVEWKPYQNAVNFAAAKPPYNMDHWPFRLIDYAHSHEEMMLQVNDLGTGIVGFWRNLKHREEKHQFSPKGQLARHMKNTLGFNSLLTDTGRFNDYFTMWLLKPRD